MVVGIGWGISVPMAMEGYGIVPEKYWFTVLAIGITLEEYLTVCLFVIAATIEGVSIQRIYS